MDCFVVSLPCANASRLSQAMTSGCTFAFPRRDAPGLCMACLRKQRAQETPGASRTRSLVCKVESTRVSHHRFGRDHPAFPAQWFYGLFRTLPGDRAFLPPSSLRSLLLRNLTPASGRQDHTTSPSAFARSSSARQASTASRFQTSVTIAKRPSCGGGTRGDVSLICGKEKAEYFSAKGWTTDQQAS